MKESVDLTEFMQAGDRDPGSSRGRIRPSAWAKQASGNVLEGAIFLWADEVGRPEAAAQMFLLRSAIRPDGEWHHEFTSLAAGTLHGEPGRGR